MELRRRRGVQTVISYPVIDADGDYVTGLSFSPQISTWTDVVFPSAFLTVEPAAELGSSGWYLSTLSATQTSADYLAFIASPTTSGTKRQHLLINMTAVASVTNVGSVTYAVPLNWASISGTGTAQNFSQTQVASINAPVPILWSSITSPGTAVNFSLTQIASVNAPVALLWSSVTSPGATNAFTGTTVASVNNPVGILWSSITSPGAAQNLTGTQVASVNNPVPTNWASISNPSATNVFSATTIATVGRKTTRWARGAGRMPSWSGA